MPRIVACHGTRADIPSFRPYSHFGSGPAAVQRLESVLGRGLPKVIVVEIGFWRALLVPDGGAYPASEEEEAHLWAAVEAGVFTEDEARGLRDAWRDGPGTDRERQDALAAAYVARGVDLLVYENRTEDRGSLSVVALDPERLRVRETVLAAHTGIGALAGLAEACKDIRPDAETLGIAPEAPRP